MSDSVRSHRRQLTRLPHPWDSPGKNTGMGCHFLLQCMKVKSESEVAQSHLTLSDPMDCSPPGSSIHGTFQARVNRGSNPCLLHLLHWQEDSLPLSHVTLEAQAANSVKSLKEETFLWTKGHWIQWPPSCSPQWLYQFTFPPTHWSFSDIRNLCAKLPRTLGLWGWRTMYQEGMQSHLLSSPHSR